MLSKTEKRRKLAYLAILTLVLALSTTFALAGPGRGGRHGAPGHGDGGMMPRIFHQLDLNDEQRDQIHQLMDSHRADMEGAREEVQAAHSALAERIHADQLDETAIREAAAAVATLMADHAVVRAGMFQQIRQVLTPEQQELAKQLMQERESSMEDRPFHGKHGHGRGFRGPGGF